MRVIEIAFHDSLGGLGILGPDIAVARVDGENWLPFIKSIELVITACKTSVVHVVRFEPEDPSEPLGPMKTDEHGVILKRETFHAVWARGT